MKRRDFLALSAAPAMLLLARRLALARTGDEPVDVEAMLKPIREKFALPALGAAIFDKKRCDAGVVGVRALGHPEAATRADKWHLGSCTKAMTATLIARLVEAGKLEWTTTVGEVFGDAMPHMHEKWKDVAIEHLLRNRGGAPGGLDADGLWGKLWALDTPPIGQRVVLVEGVTSRPPECAPGEKFIYSNAGFSIAGAMAETRMKKPWEALMQEWIFDPLHMASAGVGAPGTANGDAVDQPRGHTGRGKDAKEVGLGKGSDNPSAIAPAGKVHCSLEDWAKFLRLHVWLDDKDLISQESWRRLHDPDPKNGGEYAMGWGLASRPWGGKVLTHSGSNTMWYCVAWLAPEKGFGVAVTTNIGAEDAPGGTDAAAAGLISSRA